MSTEDHGGPEGKQWEKRNVTWVDGGVMCCMGTQPHFLSFYHGNVLSFSYAGGDLSWQPVGKTQTEAGQTGRLSLASSKR